MLDILVVDDELGIRNVLSEILREAGYYVFSAGSADEATQLIENHQFALALVDIWMPNKDGLKMLTEWNQRHRVTFPVIMMSGHATIDFAKQALQQGAVDFLEKPISLKKLLTTIELTLLKWKDQQRLAEEARTGAGSRRSQKNAKVQQKLPMFELPEYGLFLDFNRPFRDVLLEFERAYFTTVLNFVNHSVANLSRHAGMERTHLYRKIRQLGIDVENMRDQSRAKELHTVPQDESAIRVHPIIIELPATRPIIDQSKTQASEFTVQEAPKRVPVETKCKTKTQEKRLRKHLDESDITLVGGSNLNSY